MFCTQRTKGIVSAVKTDLAKSVCPFVNDLAGASLDDLHNNGQHTIGNAAVVVGNDTAALLRDPNLCGVGAGHSFGDMDVYRFQRVIFIRPKENDITQNHECRP